MFFKHLKQVLLLVFVLCEDAVVVLHEGHSPFCTVINRAPSFLKHTLQQPGNQDDYPIPVGHILGVHMEDATFKKISEKMKLQSLQQTFCQHQTYRD